MLGLAGTVRAGLGTDLLGITELELSVRIVQCKAGGADRAIGQRHRVLQ